MDGRPHLSKRQELGVALARFTWRRLFVRLVAVATCLVALVGVWATVAAYRQVDAAEAAAQSQLAEIGETFNQVSSTLRTLSDSASHAAGTVNDAKTSLGDASAATRNAAATLDQAAGLVNFSIAGVRPLAGLDTIFRDQATQLRTVAKGIDDTNGSLTGNSGDLRAISADLTVLAGSMNGVAQQVRQLAGYGPGPSALLELTRTTRMILTWSVIVHLVLFAIGISLFLLTLEKA